MAHFIVFTKLFAVLFLALGKTIEMKEKWTLKGIYYLQVIPDL